MDLLEATVEVTKAALAPSSSGAWIERSQKIAEFMEVVYNKLKALERAKFD